MQVQAFLDICKLIEFLVSMEKTFWASELLAFLGLLIDTKNQFIAIPVDKVQRAKALIEAILEAKSKKVTVRSLQKLTGFLNFLCRAIVPGRPFLRRMYYYIPSNQQPFHHIRVNREIRADLITWLKFLHEPTVYCRPFLDFSEVLSAEKLDWYTD